MKRHPDYLEYDALTGSTKYVSDNIVKGRRVCLYGISVAFAQSGNRLEMQPCIPGLGPLMRLLQDKPQVNTCRWTGKKWKPVLDPIVPKPGNGPESEALSR